MTVLTPLEPARPSTVSPAAAVLIEPRHALHASLLDRLEVAVASSCAPHHAVNEDAHSPVGKSGRLFVVADGVGSGAMPAVASDELVTQLHRAVDHGRIDEAAVCQAVLDADRTIRATIAAHTDLPGAATAAWCVRARRSGAHWLVGWVGDCRVYRIGSDREDAHGGRRVQLLTDDDTYARLGEAPPVGGSASDPARMIGNGAVTRPNVVAARLRRGETFVLCSDGAHRHLEPSDLEQRLHAVPSLAGGCAELVALARSRGSRDDATVLVVHRMRGLPPLVTWMIVGLLAVMLASVVTLLARDVDWTSSFGTEPALPAPPTVRIER